MKSLSLLFVGVLGVSGAAFAQAPTATPTPAPTATPSAFPDLPPAPRKLPHIGVDVSAFFPTSSKTRRTFGSAWTSIGLGLGSTLIYKKKVYPDFNILSKKDSGNRAFALIGGARILMPLETVDRANPPTFAPYAGFGLNLVYASIKAPSNNTDDKGLGVGANAALGTTLGRTFFVEGRYSLFSSTADFNLSGAQLMVGARF